MKICLSCEGVSATGPDQCDSCGIPMVPAEAVHFPQRRGEMDAANPLLGTRLDGKYRITSVLGRGGMGTVYRAVHEVSLVPVALKLLHPRYGSRPDHRRAFLAEARKAGRVVHDHCARVLDVGETEDATAYLAMELAEGETLDEWIRGGRGVAPGVAVAILDQICRALVAIHAAGLVHRDLSARNVMVAMRDGAPQVKVLDFGIAKAAALVAREGHAEAAGEPAGFANPVFSAPEHLAGGPVDARADLYSLGVIASLLLTGELPVAASEPREAARATMAGDLRPMPHRPGVPRRLRRLVEQCLSSDPERRPASAGEVQEELGRIRGAPRRRVRTGTGAILLGVALLLVLLLARGDPFLRPLPGPLDLFTGTLSRSAAVSHLTSSRLAVLRFYHGGFDAGRLHAEVSRDGALLLRRRLEPAVERGGGSLVLSTAQTGWRTVVDGMAKVGADGPVDLVFLVPGRAPLGAVRLLVDDTPPTVDWSLQEAGDDPGGVVITGSTRLLCRCSDAGGVDEVVVLVELPGRGPMLLPLSPGAESLALGRELAALLAGVGDHGAGTVAVRARDRAGNEVTTEPRPFRRCDLLAPTVEMVTGAAGEAAVSYSGPVTTLRLRLSESEDGLRIIVLAPDGREQAATDLRPAGAEGWLQVRLEGRADTPLQPFHSGPHTLVVVDGVGNRTQRSFPITFRNRRVDPTLEPAAPGDQPVALLGSEVVLAPTGGQVRFGCSESFAVVSAILRSSDGGPPVPPLRATVEAPGQTLLAIPPLMPGSYVMEIRVDSPGDDAPVTLPYPVRVLPEAITLRIPPVGGRFLPAFLDARLLRRLDGDSLCDGPGWRIDPALLPFLRGRLWVGGEVPSPVPLPERGAADAPLLPLVKPVNGRNLMALELSDVLRRPVRVLAGETPVPGLEVQGRLLAVVADFHHHSEPPVVVGEEIRVEHGQPARLQIRSPLPFLAADRPSIRLGLAQSEIPATAVEATPEGGSLLTFQVPVGTWSALGNLGALSADDFARNLLHVADAYLVTPAAERAHQLVLPLRTSRSTLAPIQVSALDAPGRLPPALRAITLLPVLAPSGPMLDPVPADLPGRGRFRPQRATAVRNLSDFYLQDREVTRSQYLEIVDAFLALPTARRPAAARLVHGDDPLAAGRLSRSGMLPAGLGGRPEALADWVAAAADAAVVGVDFFQAWSACRMLSFLVTGDPDLLRLPLGCELELAALVPGSGALNGPASHRAGADWGAVADAAGRWQPEGSAPSADDARAAGDIVPTADGRTFFGLDFGVREWVLDLPEVEEAAAEALLREWRGDHVLHLTRAAEFAAGKPPPADLAGRLRTFGVVRGLASGERTELLDAGAGPGVAPIAGRRLPASVPGVVRTEQLRRDGRDLLLTDRADPRLRRIGLRVAGGAQFAQWVRSR